MTQHTSWTVTRTDRQYRISENDTDTRNGYGLVCMTDGVTPIDAEHAALIAAAPETAAERDRLREVNAELLAALDLLYHAVARGWDEHHDEPELMTPGVHVDVIRRARAVIAKATP